MPGSCRRLPTPPRTVRWPRALYPAPTGPSAPRPPSPPSVPERPLCGPSPRFPPAPPLPPPARPLIVPPRRRPPPPAPGPSLPLTSRGAAGPRVGSPARLDRNARSLRRLTSRTQGRELGGLRLQNPGRVGIQSPKSRCSKWKMLQPSTRVSDGGAGYTNS